jgi:hypothetical protein
VETTKRVSHRPNMRWRRTVATVAAAGLTGASLLAASSPALASATARTAAPHKHSTLLGQIAVQGHVSNTAGQGVAGAKVELYAWPSNWPGKQPMHPGERVPLRSVGQAFSTASGLYTIRISHPAALKTSALRDGTVNLQVAVAGSRAWLEFPLQITSTSAGPELARISARPGARWTPKSVALHVSGSGWKAALRPNDTCTRLTNVFDKNYAKTWGAVDETYERYSGISATAKLSSSQKTTFSVGISGSGDAGSFSASGTFSLGDSVTTQFDPFAGPGSQGYQANYTPSEYTAEYEPGNCFVDDFSQPSAQDDGDREVGAGSIPSTPTANCDLQHGVASKTYSSTKATTISSGLTIAEIEFTASAQTGWTGTDTITYKDTGGGDWHTCGQNADPANGSPGRIVTGLPNGGGH